MKVKLGGRSLSFALGLLLSVGGIGCSSSQQDQSELQLQEGNQYSEQDGQYQGEQGDQQDSQYGNQDGYGNAEQGDQGGYGNEYGADSDGNYESAQESNYNSANEEDLEGLLNEDIAEDSSADYGDTASGNDYSADSSTNVAADPAAYDNAEAPVENYSGDAAADSYTADTAATSAPVETAAGPSQPAAAGLPELGSKMSYIVQRGDTLGVISQKIYGNMDQWREIAELTGLENPNLIYPGDVVYYQLTEASLSFAAAYENAPKQEVVVQSGDTLVKIAKNIFGDSAQWKSIWRYNDQVGNPDQLEVGQTLVFVSFQDVMASIEAERKSNEVASVQVTGAKEIVVMKNENELSEMSRS